MSLITETAIANKALQRIGADEIGLVDPTQTLWTEVSRNAKEIRKTYDITRRFELRRNQWRFSIRTQVLRPFDLDPDTDAETMRVTFATWSADTDYVANDIVERNGMIWQALVDTGDNSAMVPVPSVDPDTHNFLIWTNYFGNRVANTWDDETEWMAGELVYVSSDVFMSLRNNNKDNLTSDTAYWFPVTGATLSSAAFIYPIGAGPLSDSQTRNVYMVPSNFMREAPQAPKQGSYPALGAPTNLSYNDWNFESDYFTSVMSDAIAFRFVADIQDPAAWDPMFVNGMSCALALETCEVITQSTAKLGAIGNQYLKFMSEARIVNGIETGPVEPPLDSYLQVRY